MEFLTILLSGLLAFVSPAGVVIDHAAENAIRSQFSKVEQLQVRVDNAPSYQIVQGKVERVRVAGRGLWLTPDVRIEALELETDPINLDLQSLRQKGKKPSLKSLKQPLQAGVRVVLTEENINQALQSPAVMARLQQLGGRIAGGSDPELLQRYQLLNPQVKFLGNNRLLFQTQLKQSGITEPLSLTVETGLGILAGKRLDLINPTATFNGKPVPPFVVTALKSTFSNRFDLSTLEEKGIIARLLQLKIEQNQLEVATFVRVEPTKPSISP